METDLNYLAEDIYFPLHRETLLFFTCKYTAS